MHMYVFMKILLLILLFIFLDLDFKFHSVVVDGKKIKLKIWDKPGYTPPEYRYSGYSELDHIARLDGWVMVSWGCGEGVVRFVSFEKYMYMHLLVCLIRNVQLKT